MYTLKNIIENVYLEVYAIDGHLPHTVQRIL